VRNEPRVAVGIMDRRPEVFGRLNGSFSANGSGPVSGPFSAKAEGKRVLLFDEANREICRSSSIKLRPSEDPTHSQARTVSEPTFTLFHVTVGNRFHWEKAEDQTFRGDLIFRTAGDGTLAAINEILLEDYLTSVISSEMSPLAPQEFLKAHAILSRTWLLAALDRKRAKGSFLPEKEPSPKGEEVIRWYDREDHDLFDVCSDDHCQRYQGITKIATKQTEEAVRETRGKVIAYKDEICDARYSKACGGITECFDTAWGERQVPYLASITDGPGLRPLIKTEGEASAWILSEPEAYCNTKDERLLEKILPDVDRETKNFFRWTIGYSRKELEEILGEKSGYDFGTLKEVIPLRRGPSARISRLKIVGSKRSMVVGKELEIRRWLSRSHLYSSAFVVKRETDRFIFYGAGWGHGVGLCQIGAAVMAARGFTTEQILAHYFSGAKTKKIY